MNELPTAPLPLINPVALEKWNGIGPTTTVNIPLTKQDWDVVLSALLDINASVQHIGAFASSATMGTPPNWQEFSNFANRNGLAQQRIVRFIETVMYRAEPL